MALPKLMDIVQQWMGSWRTNAGRRSTRRWAVRPSIAAEVLETRTTLSPSITSFYLLNDTGTAGDNVTADGTVAGTVSDPDYLIDCIEFDFDGDGLVDEWTSVNLDGGFEYDTTGFLASGSVTIRARVSYWTSSDELAYGDWVSVTFTYNRPPEITEFYSESGPNNEWTFYGTVDDENIGELTIVFGGVLEGRQVLVDPDGTFKISAVLESGTIGTATAQTTDGYGEASNVAETMVT